MSPESHSDTSAPLSAKDRYKKTRKENQLTQGAMDKELDCMAVQVEQLLVDASKRIGVEVAELTSQFLARSAATHEKKPTAWNGLVSKTAAELAHKKEEPGLRGAAFMRFVVQHIREHGLYENLTEKQKSELREYAQKIRDDRLNAGQAKTVDQRLTQGAAKDEVFDMCKRLGHLHSILGIEVLTLAVRGSSQQGMKPVYFASPKARQFLETHIKLQMGDFIDLLEESVINGATGVAKKAQQTKSQLKTLLRDLLIELLRDAVVTPASDGWAPITEDRSSVKMSYVQFKNIKQLYGVDVFGWEMEDSGAMKDPSNLGGSQALRQWIAKVETGKVGFKRMTKDEHNAWLKEHKKELATQVVTVRSKTKKRSTLENSQSGVSEPSRKKGKKASAASKEHKEGSMVSVATASPHNNEPASSAAGAPSNVVATVDLDIPTETITLTPITATTVSLPSAHYAMPFEAPLVPLDFSQAFGPSASSDNTFFDEPSSPVTPTGITFDLGHSQFPSFAFNDNATASSSAASSPHYPLVPVGQPRTPGGAIQATTSRSRRDSFVNTSPADWLARSQRTPRRRTRNTSSVLSRSTTPCPQDPNVNGQILANVPTSAASLYRSELAAPNV